MLSPDFIFHFCFIFACASENLNEFKIKANYALLVKWITFIEKFVQTNKRMDEPYRLNYTHNAMSS